MTPRPRTLQITKRELVRIYVKGRYSVRDIALDLGTSKSAVYRELAKHGIPRRPQYVKRGMLDDIPLDLLKKNIKAEGLRGHARTLGMSAAGLSKTVARREGKRKRKRC